LDSHDISLFCCGSDLGPMRDNSAALLTCQSTFEKR